MEGILELRRLNQTKFEKDRGSSLYCVCQSPFGKFMIRCDLCLEWFHPTCVPLPKLADNEDDSSSEEDDVSSQALTAYKIAMHIIPFLCPCCARSKRPSYDQLLDLLKNLSMLPLKMVESEAFRILMERYLRWEEEAGELLAASLDRGGLVKDPPVFHQRLHVVSTLEGEEEEVLVTVHSFREVRGMDKVHRVTGKPGRPVVKPKMVPEEEEEEVVKEATPSGPSDMVERVIKEALNADDGEAGDEEINEGLRKELPEGTFVENDVSGR